MAFHQYNTDAYNEAQYNSDINFWWMRLSDSIASADTDVANFAQALAETLSMADGRTVSMTRLFGDSIVLIDTLSKGLQNKVLSESVRLQDWLNIRKNPAQNIWGD